MSEAPSSALRAGYARASQGKFGQALPYYEAGLRRHRDDAAAWTSFAAVLTSQDRLDEALICARKALTLNPGDPNVLRNLSHVLHQLEQYDDCLPLLARAQATEGNTWRVCLALALNAYARGDLKASEGYFTDALGAAGTLGDDALVSILCTHMAYPVLGQDDYVRGLALMAHRFNEIPNNQAWALAPEWKGEDLTDKIILLHHDQGDGDTLQFCRFIPALCAAGANVLLAVPQRLIPLFRGMSWYNLPGFAVCDLYDDLPAVDYHSPLATYMRFLHWRLPRDAWQGPYFTDPGSLGPFTVRLRPLLDEHSYRIGLVWTCRPTPDSERRNIPLTAFLAALQNIPRIQLYGLQVGPGAAQAEGLGMLITDLSPYLCDWGETAAAMQFMDLVISVDTAPLHLAGAMAKECIGLIPYRPCWRWHPRDSEATPWYPTMQLLRQARPRDWSGPLTAMRQSVERRVIFAAPRCTTMASTTPTNYSPAASSSS